MPPAVTTPEALLEGVRKSGLVDSVLLDEYAGGLAARGELPPDPRQLALHMIREGLLTNFQARQLLEGKFKGFVINGKYKLLELIAAGGMGTVYLCEHVLMRRLVAMKILPKDKLEAPGSVDRFLREARAAAALDHPNIVRAFDLDILPPSNSHCLVMEYVDGVSLGDVVRKAGPLAVGRAVSYAAQAALGLQHAHENGLVHRDIKPSNVLLTRQGVVKILDMGLARFFEDKGDNLTQQHGQQTILGTADYIAPEQATSPSVDIRADIYSLGCTLYYMLTGRPPFPEGTAAQKLIWHQARVPDSVQKHRSDAPAALAAVVARMMEKDPARRQQTPIAVAEALKPWLTDVPIPPSETELPPLAPALRRYAADSTRAARSSATYPAFRLPAEMTQDPTPSGAASAESVNTVVDLAVTAVSWRGRALTDGAADASQSSMTRPMPAGISGTGPSPVAGSGVMSRWGWAVLGGLMIAGAVFVVGMSAWQNNRPRGDSPASAVKNP